MPITVNSNIQSLKAQRTLGTTTAQLNKTYERLSSGLRIVRASDDAAGLSIADALKADQRIAGVAIRNANDGVSMIAIADGALAEMGNVLTRMAELAEQSANGTLSTTQRSALDLEFAALGSEIGRIAATTTFNGIALLSGSATVSLQVGFSSASTSQISYNGVDGTLSSLNLGQGSTLSFSLNASTSIGGQAASKSALDAVKIAISSLATIRGTLGAAESRLNAAISNLQVSRENFAAAESQIRDVDVAQEAANLTRLNILQQAGASVLAQANQQPQLALSLLQG